MLGRCSVFMFVVSARHAQQPRPQSRPKETMSARRTGSEAAMEEALLRLGVKKSCDRTLLTPRLVRTS